MDFNYVEIVGLLLFLIGIYGVIARRNIMKTVLSLSIIDIGVITFFLGIRNEVGANPPIGDGVPQELMADPVPQALMITAIVIGVAVTAVALMMFSGLYHRYGSTNWMKVFKIRREEQKK
ncbi:MAG: cation:proton antiporter subunit C [Eubacteriales bacterium]